MPVRREMDRHEAPKARPENYAEIVIQRALEFEGAFRQWQQNQEPGDKSIFSLGWLRSHGYQGLAKWIYRNNAVEDILDQCSPDVRDNLTEKRGYTPEHVQSKFAEAHAAWKKTTGAVFDREWLRQNKYSGLERHVSDHLDWPSLVDQLPKEIQDDFELHTQRYTLDSALEKFREAHAAWRRLPEDTRPAFTAQWMRENGFSGVEKYLTTNYGDFGMLAISAGEAVARDYEDHFRYTEALALAVLRKAHAEWKGQREGSRGDFNVAWLRKHNYSGMYNWARSNFPFNGIVGLVDLDREIRQDFTIRRR